MSAGECCCAFIRLGARRKRRLHGTTSRARKNRAGAQHRPPLCLPAATGGRKLILLNQLGDGRKLWALRRLASPPANQPNDAQSKLLPRFQLLETLTTS